MPSDPFDPATTPEPADDELSGPTIVIPGTSSDLESDRFLKDSKSAGYDRPRLPRELFRNIVDGLSMPLGARQHRDPALVVLAHTCRAMQVEAERVIYRDITFQSMTLQAWHINNILHTRAAEYVETLTVTIANFAIELEELSENDDRLPESFSYTLPFGRMTRLRTLTMWFLRYHKPEEIKLFKQLNESLLPNILRHFWTFTEIPFQQLQFLCRQTQLRRLTTYRIPDDFLKDNTFLPNLEDLDLNGSQTDQSLHLLQTRTLRALTITFRHAHLDLPFRGNFLVLLEMKFQSVSPSDWILFLDRRAVDCPNLVCLFLQLAGESEPPLDNSEEDDWFSPVIRVLEPWRQLRVLQLKAITTTPSGFLVSKFKTLCRLSCLQNVVLQVTDNRNFSNNLELCRGDGQGWDVAEILHSKVLDWKNSWRSAVTKVPLVV